MNNTQGTKQRENNEEDEGGGGGCEQRVILGKLGLTPLRDNKRRQAVTQTGREPGLDV